MTFRRPLRGDGRVLLGVCGGLARRWDLQPRTVRLALAVTLVPFGAGLLVYAALALVMPADGASDAEVGWRGEIGRSILEALMVLAVVLAAALVAVFAGALAVFGLAAIALLLATAGLAGVIALDHPRAWILGALALLLAVPAAIVELTDVSVARQAGDLRVAITRPQDVRAEGYRAGLGSLLLDLRDFDAEEGTTTTIRGRSDLRGFVVALPRNRCFNLEVDYALDRTWLRPVAERMGRPTLVLPSALGYSQPFVRSADGTHASQPAEGYLVAFGRAFPGDSGRYRREVADPRAPTIRLELQTGRSQIHVRDYPLSLDPLAEPQWPMFSPPVLEKIVDDADLDQATRRELRGATARSAGGTVSRVVPRGRTATGRINEALRALDRREQYPAQQAPVLAGPCAAPSVVAAISRRMRRQLDLNTRNVKSSSFRGAKTRALLEYQAGLERLLRKLTVDARDASSSGAKGGGSPLVVRSKADR